MNRKVAQWFGSSTKQHHIHSKEVPWFEPMLTKPIHLFMYWDTNSLDFENFNYEARLGWNEVQGDREKWNYCPTSGFKIWSRSSKIVNCSFLKSCFSAGWSTPQLNGFTKIVETSIRSIKTSSLFLVLSTWVISGRLWLSKRYLKHLLTKSTEHFTDLLSFSREV